MSANQPADEGFSSAQDIHEVERRKGPTRRRKKWRESRRCRRKSPIYRLCVFLPFTTTEVLHTNAQRQLLNCLHATTLKVGLLLHFGPQPRLFRLVAPNTTCRQ